MMEENLQRTYARDPFEQKGGYVKRCRGINLYCKLENSQGSRIQQLFVEGMPVEENKTYHVAFVTQQGVGRKYGSNRKELKIKAIEALCNYLETNSPINADLRGAVVAV